jgi:hypothetical protein
MKSPTYPTIKQKVHIVSSIHTYIGSKFHIVHPTKSKQKGSTRRRVDSINASFLIESKSANWERRKLEEEEEED